MPQDGLEVAFTDPIIKWDFTKQVSLQHVEKTIQTLVLYNPGLDSNFEDPGILFQKMCVSKIDGFLSQEDDKMQEPPKKIVKVEGMESVTSLPKSAIEVCYFWRKKYKSN